MMKHMKNVCTMVLCGVILFGLAIFAWIKAPGGYSNAERRALSQLPKLSASNLESGKFMNEFDDYSMDQFPMRDGFRSFKAAVSKFVLRQKDNHGLYSVDGVISKLEYPLNKAKVNLAAKKIAEIRDTYLKETNCRTYLSIIPDKNYFLAPLDGYPTMDYGELVETVIGNAGCDEYIDLFDLLSLEDYYCTDQHWRQECIVDVAQRIGETMRTTGEYTQPAYDEKILDQAFYGAYVGQSALPYDADTIRYLTNEVLQACTVTSYNSGIAQEAQMYDMSKAYGRDPYEMFLSGSDPLLVIENPNAETEGELVVFRDSFGSSLTPLLVEQYAKITVVDLRYMSSALLPEYITFDSQDVLFIYSTLILNNSISK